ncbi:NADH-quinone oxidoreductase subunit M, partial [Pseudomonas sp. GW456-12-10-14-LB2]
DMTARERAIFAPLVVATILLGVYPALVTDVTGPAVEALVGQVQTAQAAWEPGVQVAQN